MKECAVNRERAVITNNQVTEVAEPRQGALDFPAPSVASQRSSVLGHGLASIPSMRRDQFDPALRQPLPQRVAVVTTVGDQAQRFLPRPTRVGSAAYMDRRERRFREPRFVWGCRTKVVSQRKTLAVDHHHPLRALATLGFSDSRAPFWREQNSRPGKTRSTAAGLGCVVWSLKLDCSSFGGRPGRTRRPRICDSRVHRRETNVS